MDDAHVLDLSGVVRISVLSGRIQTAIGFTAGCDSRVLAIVGKRQSPHLGSTEYFAAHSNCYNGPSKRLPMSDPMNRVFASRHGVIESRGCAQAGARSPGIYRGLARRSARRP